MHFKEGYATFPEPKKTIRSDLLIENRYLKRLESIIKLSKILIMASVYQ